MSIHKVFISYHHLLDQYYKDYLVEMGCDYRIFIDRSVNTGDIDEGLTDALIREIIRDRYLRDSTVTIVLVGRETKRRKHVDWKIYSSMFDGKKNKKSGILVVSLPGTSDFVQVSHAGEESIYPDIGEWTSVNSRAELARRYPHMPARIIDNLLCPGATISVVPWERVKTSPRRLKWLVDATFDDRRSCKYDLHRPMRPTNSTTRASRTYSPRGYHFMGGR